MPSISFFQTMMSIGRIGFFVCWSPHFSTAVCLKSCSALFRWTSIELSTVSCIRKTLPILHCNVSYSGNCLVNNPIIFFPKLKMGASISWLKMKLTFPNLRHQVSRSLLESIFIYSFSKYLLIGFHLSRVVSSPWKNWSKEERDDNSYPEGVFILLRKLDIK